MKFWVEESGPHLLTNFDEFEIPTIEADFAPHRHRDFDFEQKSHLLPSSSSFPPFPLAGRSTPHVIWGYFIAFSHIDAQGKAIPWLDQKIALNLKYD